MSNFIEITFDVLDINQVSKQVTEPCTGATSLFVGTTRDNFQGKKVIQLEYEAYVPMAKKKLNELCNRLRVKWSDLHHIAIYHRLGLVGPCEASVIIGISSAHRQASLEAVQFAIDELKATVPIWKKELYEDGSEWKENKECFFSNAAKAEESQVLPEELVQIQATNEEMNERIDKYIESKRSEIDASNVLEFCEGRSEESKGCARTDAVLAKKKDSKSHLRKSSVQNPPMTQVLNERLNNAEEQMGVNVPIPKDVYARLKTLEDRLVLLERIAPQVHIQGPKDDNEVEQVNKSQRKEELAESLISINDEIAQLRSELMD